MNDHGRLLIIDDEPSIRRAVRRLLEKDGHTVEEAQSGVEGVERASSTPFSCIILDLKMPGMDGEEVFNTLREEGIQTPVIILTGHGDVPTAVEFLRRGAVDFIEKPPSADRLRIAIHNALRTKALTDTIAETRTVTQLKYRLVGASGVMKRLHETIERVAPSRAPVLITGPSGSGKELVARALHEKSGVKRETFVRVNCAAIPDELIESELFGHEKGSFTGASSRQVGKFVLADGGTIFLDEIGDMSLKAQAKVLRVLDGGEVEPVGARRTLHVNVRVIAATNKDIEAEMQEGRFREDLFFRLNVIPVAVPPLAEHTGDIPGLVDHFCRLWAAENNLPERTFSAAAKDKLAGLTWRGNIRELKNFIERCLILIARDPIDVEDLPVGEEEREGSGLPLHLPWKAFRKESERIYLIAQLEKHDWNVAGTAKAIGIPRSHLYRLMTSYAIERKESHESH